MGWIESLQKAIDYIEENLLKPIRIEEIARQANTSVSHFQRIFTVLTDSSVGEYIRCRRLTLVAHDLSKSDDKIIDLAYKYGYETPEAFTKAFRRQHGITPSEARGFSGELTSYNRLVIQVNLKGGEPMKVRMVERDGFQIAGVKQEFSCVNEENLVGIPKMWNEVHENGINDLLFDINARQIQGVLGVCVDVPSENGPAIDYWIATEFVGATPQRMLSMEIPAAKWAVFEVRGPMPAIQDMWKKILSEWFPSSGFEHTTIPAMEVYAKGNPSNPNYFSEIWIPVK